VSPRSPTTREDLLEATLELIRSEPFTDLSLARVAARAGVTRQALYLHFPSKIDLLLSLVDWMDQRSGLYEAVAEVMQLVDPIERLLTMNRVAARYTPEIADVALALRAARDSDDAAHAAWKDRMHLRLDAMREVVKGVADVGALREGWTVRTAADVVFALHGPTLYEDLVRERGWSQKRYADFIDDSVRRLLVTADHLPE
jgi:AcrR family transcriptional regulator